MKYVPMDELLELPTVKILRALDRSDPLEAIDLLDLAGVPARASGAALRNVHTKALSRMVQRGEASKTGKRFGALYAITDLGRRVLAQGFAVALADDDVGVPRRRKRHPSDAARRRRNAAAAKERYRLRRDSRRCVRCNAGLQEDDKVYCVECTEKRDAEQQRYRTTDQARLRAATKVRTAYWRDPARARALKRDQRLRKKLAHLCMCCSAMSLEDSLFCAVHREANRRGSAERGRRRRAEANGIGRLAAVAR